MSKQKDEAIYRKGWDDGFAKGAAAARFQLEAENAKLRELVADMWNGMCGYGHDCRYCEHYELYAEQRFVGECEYHRRMRELGVEV